MKAPFGLESHKPTIETESEKITESEVTNNLKLQYQTITTYVDGQIHTVKDIWYDVTNDDTIVYGTLDDGRPFVSKLKQLIDFQEYYHKTKNNHIIKLVK